MIMKSSHVGILLTHLSHGTVTRAGGHGSCVLCSTRVLQIFARDLALGMNISEFVETKANGKTDPTRGRNK